MTDETREISIFLVAIEKEDNEELAAYLDQACEADQELRAKVEALVATHRRGNSFLERPAPGLDPAFNINQAALDAGLSATFGAEAAVVIGDAGHSVLESLSEQLPEVPRVVLRDADDGAEKVVRPNLADVPFAPKDGRYQLHGEIARGGMGAVIKARDADLGRDLAIKVLLDSHNGKPEVLQRFVEEAQIGGQLQHPGIVPVYELGQLDDRRPFFSMKLVKGDTLASLLTQRAEPGEDLPTFLGIFEQVCQTMAYAHSKGVMHRDLKPSNIMVGAFGEVQVMDWGLAKVLGSGGNADEKRSLDKHRDISVIQTRRSTGSDSPAEVGSQTQMGSVLGTPAYMPPEQALGEVDRLDERADVFGLGAILCEILTGKPPYVGSDGIEVFRQASRGKLEACFTRMDECGAEQQLTDLAKHMLAVEPEDRLRNAGVVAEKLTEYLAGVQQRLKQAEVARAEAQARAEDAIRRRKLHIAIAGLMILLAVGAGFSAVRFWQQREAQTALAAKNSILAEDNAAKRRQAELAQEQTAIEKNNVATQRDRAIALQQTLRRELYIADMQQLQQAYQEGATDRVDDLLTKYVPSEGESDLRGWEWYYWWRASHLHDHNFQNPEPFSSLAVAPDRTWIALRGWQPDVHILDAVTLKEITTLNVGRFRHHFGWTEFAVSPDGRLFACIAHRWVTLYRTDDWSQLGAIRNERELQAIVFSPSGLLAAADTKGRVKFWDVEEKVEAGPRLETGHPLSCLAFSPDGKKLATGHLSGGNTKKTPGLLIWDMEGRQLETQLSENVLDVTALSWRSNGDLNLLAAGSAAGTVRLWDGTTYSERAWLHADGSILNLAFSPNCEKLVAGTARNNAVVVWDTNSARRISVMKGHFRPVFGVAFANDNQTLWSSGQDGYLKSWNLSKSVPFRRLSADPQVTQGSLAFGADGQSLWLVQDGSDIHRWNAITGESLPALDVGKSARQIAFSKNGRFLAVLQSNGETANKLQIWRTDIREPTLQSNIVLDEELPEGSVVMVIADNGSIVSLCRDRKLVLLDISTGKQTFSDLKSGFTRLSLSTDGKQLIDSGWDTRVWNIANGTINDPVTLAGFPATEAQFSPDGKYVAQSFENNTVQLHDMATGEVLHTFRGHAGGVKTIDFSPDGALLASGGVDGTVRLWHVDNRSLLVTLSGHDQPISSVEFSPDGLTIASISNDGDTRLWTNGTTGILQDVRYWVWQAKVCRTRKLWESELDHWTQAIRLSPKDASLYTARSEVHLKLEQFPEAASDCKRAFRHAEVADWKRLSNLVSQLGSKVSFNTNEAFIGILSKALEPAPFNESLLKQRADLYEKVENWDDAATDHLAILKIRGKAEGWTSGPGWNTDRSKFLQGLCWRAPIFNALRRQLPEANDLWLARGRSLAQISDWSASLEAFEQYTVDRDSMEPEIWFEIACLHQILNDDEGYRRCLTRLRKQAGESPESFDAFVLARTAGLAKQDPEWAREAVLWGERSLEDDVRPWKLHALGSSLHRAGEHAAAIKRIQESIAAGWSNAQNQVVLALAQHAAGSRTMAEELAGKARHWRDEKLQLAGDGMVDVQVIDWLSLHALLREMEERLNPGDDENEKPSSPR